MLILGVDVSQDTLALALWQEGTVQALEPIPNRPDGWDRLVSALALQVPAAALAHLEVVLEPTGGYELAFALWAYQRGWPVHRPNPARVREWARSQGRRAKTDRQDALVLARYGAERSLPLWQPLPSEVSELEALLRRREEVQGLLLQERNRWQQVQKRPGMHQAVPKSVERVIGVLEEELQEIEQAIAEHTRQHVQLQQTCARLRSVPGVGAKNVVPLFVLLSRWQSLTRGVGSSRGREIAACDKRCTWERWEPCAETIRCAPFISAWWAGGNRRSSPWWRPCAKCWSGPGPSFIPGCLSTLPKRQHKA